ncbi:MAG: transcriptional regulator [Myxococcaceae bacterium]|nr:transcriptional regulator [Myxococcaceae bacterium]
MTENTRATAEPKVIKRYTNRKLYDTVESRYVTLDEIAEMVKQGVEVQIVDNRTKEDLTSVTLAQIVFEAEKKTNHMPLDVLREIIRHPGESLTGFFKSAVQPRVESIRAEAKEGLDRLLKKDGKDAVPGAEASTELLTSAPSNVAQDFLKTSQRTFEEWQKKLDERVKTVVEGVVGNLPAMGRDLGQLVQRIDALEKKLQSLEEKKK